MKDVSAQQAVHERAWVRDFADRMAQLGVRADAGLIQAMAEEIYVARATEDAVAVADEEWDAWPPHDD